LDTSILTELQRLVAPQTERIEDRRALLQLAVGNSPVYWRIDFSGATDTFTIHMITTLAEYGEIAPGRHALWAVFEVIRSRVGVEHQQRIDALRPAIESLSEIYRGLDSGAVFAVLYDEAGFITKPAKLFGHKDLLPWVGKLLDEGKHVLLTGYGGTGKTALAATLADNRLAEKRGPIVWVQVRNSKANALVEAIATLFNANEQLGRVQGGAQIQYLRATLADAGVKLLVLDDVRNDVILVPMREVAKHLSMLITARHEIENVDASVTVADMLPDDALELLIHHARNQEISEEEYRADPTSRQLCREVGYHALGTMVAGSWLAKRKRMPGDLLARIAQRHLSPATIEMPGSFIVEGRENVKMVLDETFHALKPEAQRMFRAFGSLFEPRATADLLTTCAGIVDQFVTEDALDELISWNFVTRETNCFAMHDMVHTYAETVIFGNTEPDRRSTVAAVQRYMQDHSKDFESLQIDQPNILGAAGAADDEARIDIIRILTLGGYFNACGHTVDFLALLDKVLTHFRTRKNEGTLNPNQLETLHYLLGKRGDAFFDRGDYDSALDIYRESLSLTNKINRVVILSGVIGKTLAFQGKHDEAGKYFDQGYRFSSEAEDDFLLSFILEQEAHTAGYNKDHEKARQIAVKQVAINERLLETNRDPRQRYTLLEALIHSLINLGTAEIMVAVHQQTDVETIAAQERIQASLALFQRAEQIALSMNNMALHITVLNALAEGYHFFGERERAFDLLQQVQHLYRGQGLIRGENLVIAFMREHGYPIMSDTKTN
jgi:tetratricopeptide (TPR) repeat protein